MSPSSSARSAAIVDVASVEALSAITIRHANGNASVDRKACRRRIEPSSADCSLWTGTTTSTRGLAWRAAVAGGEGEGAVVLMTSRFTGVAKIGL